jgi:hypothetical protein
VVVFASFDQEYITLTGLPFQSRVVKLLDLLPLSGIHRNHKMKTVSILL